MHPRKRASGSLESKLGIAILVGMILYVGFTLLFPANTGRGVPYARLEAGNTARAIVAALKAYHNDYGHFPEIGTPLPNGKRMICVGDPACKAVCGPNSLIFDVLRDIPRGANANHALNPQKQKYFEHPMAKDLKAPRSGFTDGPPYPASLQGCLFDPWGRQYCIVFTMDDSGTLDLSAIYSDLAGAENLVRMPVAVFSLGKDGIVGGKGYEGKFRNPTRTEMPNNVVSWQ